MCSASAPLGENRNAIFLSIIVKTVVQRAKQQIGLHGITA
jgi:hypothetical protein